MIFQSQFDYVGLENYLYVIKSPEFWTALKNTILFTVGSLLLTVGFSLIIAGVMQAIKKGKGVYRALAIFTFLWEWDNYLWPYLMLSDPEKYTLPIGLAMTQGQFVADYGPMFAGISICVIPVLIVYLIFQKTFIQGIALGGVKE